MFFYTTANPSRRVEARGEDGERIPVVANSRGTLSPAGHEDLIFAVNWQDRGYDPYGWFTPAELEKLRSEGTRVDEIHPYFVQIG